MTRREAIAVGLWWCSRPDLRGAWPKLRSAAPNCRCLCLLCDSKRLVVGGLSQRRAKKSKPKGSVGSIEGSPRSGGRK